MNVEEFRDHCMNKKGVTTEFPFDETTLVFKVMGKMFALSGIDEFASINLKCDPERAIELREQYYSIRPGWHMNKIHWNTVEVNGDANDQMIYQLIDHSYDLVQQSLTKKLKEELGKL